jgi:hypothetical protein
VSTGWRHGVFSPARVAQQQPRARAPSVAAYVGWVVVGAALAVGLLGAFTVGPIAIVVAVVMMFVLLARPAGRSAAGYGALSGAGAVPLYVAWLNRQGPGLVCTSRAATQCVSEWSPWGWLIFGIVLVAAGITAFAMSRRRAA